MPQPIAVGSVLGGRYRITQHVVTSADQDRVFQGTDEVLNRRVTILVASLENATQVATSARELATGERTDDVQVLDLGLSEGRTYLIAGGGPDPDVLLGLAYEQQVHVEPFQTDSLGSEIFGENREGEAHRYEDDEAYYTDLDQQLRRDEAQIGRRPSLLNRLSDRLNERIRPADGTAAKAAAGASALAAADAASRAQEEERERLAREAAERAEQDRRAEEARLAEERDRAEREAAERAAAEREAAERAAAEREAAEHAERERAAEDAPAAPRPVDERVRRAAAAWRAGLSGAGGASAAAAAGDGPAPAGPAQPRLRPAPRRALPASEENPFTPLAPAAARTQTPAPGLAPLAGEDRPAQHPSPAGEDIAATRPVVPEGPVVPEVPVTSTRTETTVTPASPPRAAVVDANRPSGDRPTQAGRGRRAGWLLPLLLVLGLIAALVAGALLLGSNLRSVPKDASVSPSAVASQGSASSAAGASPSGPASTAAGASSPASSPAAAAPAAPQVVSVTRSVPDMPSLDEENDGTLSNLVDGDATTPWRSYTYSRPNFGGYVESMNLVAKLERRGQVTEVVLDQVGGSGGAFTVSLADSPDGDGAREIGSGTFDAPQTVLPVPGGAAEAGYVIVSVTALPTLDVAGSDRPYGLRLTEVSVR